MRIPKFEYFHPSSMEEVCSLLYKYKGEAKVLAGGTDLLVKMKKKEVIPKVVISLKGVPNLDKIEWDDGGGLRIGPLVTHAAIVNHSIIKEKYNFLAQTCFKIGTRQVRYMGTLVGNICNASPSSIWLIYSKIGYLALIQSAIIQLRDVKLQVLYIVRTTWNSRREV